MPFSVRSFSVSLELPRLRVYTTFSRFCAPRLPLLLVMVSRSRLTASTRLPLVS